MIPDVVHSVTKPFNFTQEDANQETTKIHIKRVCVQYLVAYAN